MTGSVPPVDQDLITGPGVDQRELDRVVRAFRVLAQRERVVADAQHPHRHAVVAAGDATVRITPAGGV